MVGREERREMEMEGEVGRGEERREWRREKGRG